MSDNSSAPASNTEQVLDIQQLTTPTGIEVWLVESPSLPMVSMEVAFRNGSAYEPAAKNGLASLTASLLDEGAGELNAQAFQIKLEELGGRFGAGAGLLNTTVNVASLVEHLPQVVDLAALALQQPTFAAADVQRVKAAMIAGLKRQQEDPGAVAAKLFNAELYGDHPYARRSSGEVATLEGLTGADVRDWHATQYTRANAVVSVVGAIKPAELLPLVDKLLAPLPAGDARNALPSEPAQANTGVVTKQMPIPQSTIRLGHVAIGRDDPDYYNALVLNQIFSSGMLSSRLMDEVREKRGLVYGIGGRFATLPPRGHYFITLATNNDDAPVALEVIRAELDKLLADGVTEHELSEAHKFLLGSFPLRLDSNNKILDHLTVLQMEELGVDYLDHWRNRIAATDVAALNAAAKRLLKPEQLLTVIVGDSAALEYQAQ